MKNRSFLFIALAFAIAILIDPHGREMVQHLIDPSVRAHIGEYVRSRPGRIADLIFDEGVKLLVLQCLLSRRRSDLDNEI